MKIPVITNLIHQISLKRTRRIMRGYRVLKKTGTLDRISTIKIALTNAKIDECMGGISKFVFGAGTKDAELIIRQYLLILVGGLNLNKALLYSLGKPGSAVVHPLPQNWIKVLQQHGFEVNRLRSAFAWYGFVFLMFTRGIVASVRIFFNCIREIIRPSFNTLGKFAYFDNLTAGNLSPPQKNCSEYEIIGWYRQRYGQAGNLDTLCHSVKDVAPNDAQGIPVVSIPAAIPPLTQWFPIIRFIAWSVTAWVLVVIDVLRNRWWHAVLLSEAAKAKQVHLHASHRLARVYLFHVSNYIYRPLWSYEAAMSGSQIICYFYSVNCEPFKRPRGYPPIPYGFQAMSWPHYLVWDEYQAAFVRSAVGLNCSIKIVGSIPFNYGVDLPQDLPEKFIAVFDVQPVRSSIYQSLGFDLEYYIPENANKFLIDINEATQRFKRYMIFKRKRNIGNLVHPLYEQTLKYLSGSVSNCLQVDTDASASQLISRCEAVISAPFTSTALIARELGKPSIYYDPSGMCDKYDRAAHGVEIISSFYELECWLAALYSSPINPLPERVVC